MQQQIQVEGEELEAKGKEDQLVVYQEIGPNFGENFLLKLIVFLNTQELAILY